MSPNKHTCTGALFTKNCTTEKLLTVNYYKAYWKYVDLDKDKLSSNKFGFCKPWYR